jgi:hypothetical protein
MGRIWHPTHIRFGANTLKTFKEPYKGDPVLGECDVFVADQAVSLPNVLP